MELSSLFPGLYLLRSHLQDPLLASLLNLAGEVQSTPECTRDASPKLAGQLSLQLELPYGHPAVVELCRTVILPTCERRIRHVLDQQPLRGRGP